MLRRLKALKRERKRLGEAVAAGGKLDFLVKAARRREREYKELRKELRRIRGASVPVPGPLREADVLGMLDDLKALLQEDIAASLPVLRQCLGSIEVEPAPSERSRRPVWVARLTVDMMPILLDISTKKGLPTTRCLAYLTLRRWKFCKDVVVRLEQIPLYERIAPEVAKLSKMGNSAEVIARGLKTARCNVVYARRFDMHGIRPQCKPTRKRTGRGINLRYKEIADEVVHLRHEEKKSFKEIALSKDVSESTARRAYDFKCPEAVNDAITVNKRPFRGRYSRLDPVIYQQMCHLLSTTNMSASEIARICKCGSNTVLREKMQMEKEKQQRLSA